MRTRTRSPASRSAISRSSSRASSTSRPSPSASAGAGRRSASSATEARAWIELRAVAQLFVKFFLAVGERAGHHDVERGIEVACAAAGLRQSFSAEPQLLAALGPGRHLHRDAPIERWYPHFRTERGLPWRDRHLDLEVV